MSYTIELNKNELRILKKFLKEEHRRVLSLLRNEVCVEHNDGYSLASRELALLLLIGKLDNVITVADKITEVK